MVFRITAPLLAVLGVAQAFLAGSFLSGRYGALGLHMVVGFLMVLAALVQLVAAVLLRRAGRVPFWVLRTSITVPVLLALQAGLGVYRVLALHVPIGVFMVAGLVMMARQVWREPVVPRRGAPGDEPAVAVPAAGRPS